MKTTLTITHFELTKDKEQFIVEYTQEIRGDFKQRRIFVDIDDFCDRSKFTYDQIKELMEACEKEEIKDYTTWFYGYLYDLLNLTYAEESPELVRLRKKEIERACLLNETHSLACVLQVTVPVINGPADYTNLAICSMYQCSSEQARDELKRIVEKYTENTVKELKKVG